MDIIEFRDFCLSLPLTEETTPFDEDTLVYKVCGKMYAFASMGDFRWISVKCDPETAIEQRERYPEIVGAYHMNKKHWNTIMVDGDLPEDFIRERIRDSYLLVIRKLPKTLREDALAAQKPAPR